MTAGLWSPGSAAGRAAEGSGGLSPASPARGVVFLAAVRVSDSASTWALPVVAVFRCCTWEATCLSRERKKCFNHCAINYLALLNSFPNFFPISQGNFLQSFLIAKLYFKDKITFVGSS